MSSLIQDYGYDIFISYGHKDNKYDGWVTAFIDLKRELESAFKEDALQHQHMWVWGNNDSMLDPLRDREDFKSLIKKINDYQQFRKQAHAGAFNRRAAKGELQNILK